MIYLPPFSCFVLVPCFKHTHVCFIIFMRAFIDTIHFLVPYLEVNLSQISAAPILYPNSNIKLILE